MLADMLVRRSKRRLGARSLEPETRELITTAVANLVELGLIKDSQFAELRTGTLTRRGLSKRHIAAGLKAKGLSRETIAGAGVADIDDLAQARRYIERKRLGALRRGGMTSDSRLKDLRALARAGFSMAIAKSALADTTIDSCDEG